MACGRDDRGGAGGAGEQSGGCGHCAGGRGDDACGCGCCVGRGHSVDEGRDRGDGERGDADGRDHVCGGARVAGDGGGGVDRAEGAGAAEDAAGGVAADDASGHEHVGVLEQHADCGDVHSGDRRLVQASGDEPFEADDAVVVRGDPGRDVHADRDEHESCGRGVVGEPVRGSSGDRVVRDCEDRPARGDRGDSVPGVRGAVHDSGSQAGAGHGEGPACVHAGDGGRGGIGACWQDDRAGGPAAPAGVVSGGDRARGAVASGGWS